MFVSSGQFYVFIACVAYGTVLGVLFFLVADLTSKVKNKILRGFFDFLPFFIGAVLFVLYYNYYNFPSFRWYMIFGVFLGVILYGESFRLILAKAIKKVYNIRKTKGKKSDGK